MQRVGHMMMLAGMILSVTTVFAQQTIPVKGILDFDQKKIVVEFPQGEDTPFVLEIMQESPDEYAAQLMISRWKTDYFDLSTILNGRLIKESINGQDYLSGSLQSKYSLLNNQPFDEFSVNVSIGKTRAVVRSFTFGQFSGFGEISLNQNPVINATVRFGQLPLERVVGVLGQQGFLDSRGLVNGEIRLQGAVKKPHIRGQISSYHGTVGIHEYNTARFSFSGVYPVVQIDQSQVAQTDGLSVEIQGRLDLSNLKNFRTQIEQLVCIPLVSRDGEDLEWTLKRLRSETDGGTTEFKYMMRKQSDIDRDGGDMLGIERRMEF